MNRAGRRRSLSPLSGGCSACSPCVMRFVGQNDSPVEHRSIGLWERHPVDFSSRSSRLWGRGQTSFSVCLKRWMPVLPRDVGERSDESDRFSMVSSASTLQSRGGAVGADVNPDETNIAQKKSKRPTLLRLLRGLQRRQRRTQHDAPASDAKRRHRRGSRVVASAVVVVGEVGPRPALDKANASAAPRGGQVRAPHRARGAARAFPLDHPNGGGAVCQAQLTGTMS